MNEATRLYAWAQLRESRRRQLVLAVVLGAVGAIAIGSIAGALRTNDAVDRFLTDQRAFDVLVICGTPELDGDGYACERALRGLDEIEDTAPILELPGLPYLAGHTAELSDDTCWDGPGDVKLIVSPDGRFGSAINEQRLIAGRAADRSRPDEVVISRELAERIDAGVGDTIDFRLFGGADCLADPASWRPATALTVVGIEISPFEVKPDSGEYRSFIHATPALLATLGDLPDKELMVAARLRPGVELDDLQERFERIGISVQTGEQRSDQKFAVAQSLNSDNLQRSVRAYVIALLLFGALTAVAGLVLVGQMLNRQLRGAATEFRSLRHLGMTRRDLVAVGLANLLTVVVPAALLAAAGAHLCSAFTPVGIARIIEVDQGFRFDPTVLGLGIAVMIVGFICVAIPSLVTVTRDRAPATPPPTGRAAHFARACGGGPVTTTGLRMAFEPPRGTGAPPLRTGLGMIASAVVLLVAVVVFAGSLTHLRSSNHLVGWNWDALWLVEDDDAEPVTDERLRDVAAETPGVIAATPGTVFVPLLVTFGADQVFTPIVTFVGGPIGPTLISGRAPSGSGEIVLGRETLSRLGLREGEQIAFAATTGEGDDTAAETFQGTLTVVGTAVIPVVGGDARLGTGGAVDFEFFQARLPEARSGGVFVRVEPGRRIDEVASAAADSLGVATFDSITEESMGLDTTLRDIERFKNLPIAFAVILALLAVGVVAQVVVGSTHARRTELGVLWALGLRPRQIRWAIVIQATATLGLALVLGIPVGIALGRAAWRAYALSLGTKPEVNLATGWLVATVIGLVVVASLMGLVGSVRARRQFAAALRRE